MSQSPKVSRSGKTASDSDPEKKKRTRKKSFSKNKTLKVTSNALKNGKTLNNPCFIYLEIHVKLAGHNFYSIKMMISKLWSSELCQCCSMNVIFSFCLNYNSFLFCVAILLVHGFLYLFICRA